MKKLILCTSALLFSLGLANAQGWTATSIHDDFQQVAPYTNANGSGIYYYSGAATVPAGTRTVGKMTMEYTAAATSYLAADFGSDNGVKTPINLSTMSDIEVDIKNTNGTKDLQLRVYLKDVNGIYLEIEPNISDAVAVSDFATATANIGWSASNLVYPEPVNYVADPAVYPTVAYNGFVVPANTRKVYRIDLSSVATSMGGRKAGAYDGTEPSDSPTSTTAGTATFDITQVHVVEFVFNENTAFNLSDGAIDAGSYKYDAKGIAQSDYTGTIELYSLKIGSVLSALPADADLSTSVNEAAVIDGSLKVYPNPASEALTVSFDAKVGTDVSLTDIIGNKVYSTSANAGENKITLNTSGLSSGMYILNIATENGVVARKVTIK